MSLKLLATAIGVARLLISSRKAMKEAREVMGSARAGTGIDGEDRMRLTSMGVRLREIEARLDELQGHVRRLTTALYALAAVAVAALALAIIRLA